jgi:hypothetical protein
MSDCKYLRESWGKSFAGRCSAPDNVKTSASDNKWCMSPKTCPYLLNQSYEDESQMTNCNYSEHAKIQRKEIQKQIEELQTALKLLEIEENRKTSCEKAYRDAYGYFPITDSMSGGNNDYIAWEAFQKGYNAAYKEPTQEPSMINCFIEGNPPNDYATWQEWFNEMGSKGILHNLELSALGYHKKMNEVKKLQEKEWTYKITDEKGETNSYKNYMNSVTTLHQELFDYGFTDSQIEDIILIVNRWLPKPIEETCGMKEWDSAWTIGYNNYRYNLMEKLK